MPQWKEKTVLNIYFREQFPLTLCHKLIRVLNLALLALHKILIKTCLQMMLLQKVKLFFQMGYMCVDSFPFCVQSMSSP